MGIIRFLFCLILFAFNSHTITWIPDDNPKDSTPLTDEQKKMAEVNGEELQAQNPVDRNKLFEKYHKELQKSEIYFSLMPLPVVIMVLEYQFPLHPKPTITKTYSHRSYGVPGACCCESCI